jgi:uncharacterized UBP type Zn finger protein
MTENAIKMLLDAVRLIVNEDKRPYKEKALAIKAALDDDDRINLSEFLSWFDDDELNN